MEKDLKTDRRHGQAVPGSRQTAVEAVDRDRRKGDKIKELISDKENQELLRLVFRQTKALFKHIFPRKARGKLRIGFEDPYTTGQAMALAGLLCPFYKDSLQVIPSFEEPVLEGELACSGRIRLAALLMIAGRLMASRTFRQALKKLFALRG